MYKKIAVVGLVFVFVGAMVGQLILSIQNWNSDFIADDMVTHWDKRMSALRADLPKDAAIIGYVGDWDVLPEGEYYYADEETEYILTQYALSPVIVQRGDEHTWVIANLSTKAYEIWIKTQPENIKVVEYGPRIYLVYKP